MDTPLETCEQRDAKGLYARARRGEIPEFTGISAPYEAPENPDIHLVTETTSSDSLVDQLMDALRARGITGRG